MKTNTTLSTTSNEEITLGWSSMPAYGEVMNTLIGSAHTDATSTMKLPKKNLLNTFWSTLSNLK